LAPRRPLIWIRRPFSSSSFSCGALSLLLLLPAPPLQLFRRAPVFAARAAATAASKTLADASGWLLTPNGRTRSRRGYVRMLRALFCARQTQTARRRQIACPALDEHANRLLLRAGGGHAYRCKIISRWRAPPKEPARTLLLIGSTAAGPERNHFVPRHFLGRAGRKGASERAREAPDEFAICAHYTSLVHLFRLRTPNWLRCFVNLTNSSWQLGGAACGRHSVCERCGSRGPAGQIDQQPQHAIRLSCSQAAASPE
jgi:hypothetical protein